MGDVIDGYSIVMTVAGVCTSLGLGAIQIVGTFQCKKNSQVEIVLPIQKPENLYTNWFLQIFWPIIICS